jgi:hypothetical protein
MSARHKSSSTKGFLIPLCGNANLILEWFSSVESINNSVIGNKIQWDVRLKNKLIISITLHCIALHCIALHCIALHCIALHNKVILTAVNVDPGFRHNLHEQWNEDNTQKNLNNIKQYCVLIL